MGFSISSPGFKQFEKVLAKADLGAIIARAAADVAHGGLISDLEHAAHAAGASAEMRSDIGLYLEQGQVYCGIPNDAAGSDEAFELEYGTAVGAPTGWVRATVSRNQRKYNNAFGAALTKRLFAGSK